MYTMHYTQTCLLVISSVTTFIIGIPINQNTSHKIDIASTINKTNTNEDRGSISSAFLSKVEESSSKIPVLTTTVQLMINLTESLDSSVETSLIASDSPIQMDRSSMVPFINTATSEALSQTIHSSSSNPTTNFHQSTSVQDVLQLKSSYTSLLSSSSVCNKNNQCSITSSSYITNPIESTRTSTVISTSPLTEDIEKTTFITSSPIKTLSSIHGYDITKMSANIQVTTSYNQQFVSINDVQILTMGVDLLHSDMMLSSVFMDSNIVNQSSSTAETFSSSSAIVNTTNSSPATTSTSRQPISQTDSPKHYCEEEWVRNYRKGDYLFRNTNIFDIVMVKCHYNARATIVARRCNWDENLQQATWEKVDLNECEGKFNLTGIMQEIYEWDVNNATVEESSVSFRDSIMNNIELITSNDQMEMLFSTAMRLLTYGKSNKKVVKEVVQALGSLTNISDQSLLQEYQGNVENVLEMIGSSKDIQLPLSISTENIALLLTTKSLTTEVIRVTSKTENSSTLLGLSTTENMEDALSSNDSIEIYPSVFKDVQENSNILIYAMDDFPMYKTMQEERVISKAVSITIFPSVIIDNLTQPIELRFGVSSDQISSKGKMSCRFWDTKHDVWSTKGCITTIVNNRTKHQVICECNHMTTFAVIFTPNQLEDTEITRQPHITVTMFIGLVIAVVSIGVTFITHLCFKRLRKEVFSHTIVYFCGSLILTIITFVGGMSFVSRPLVCYIFGRLLHYFILVSFGWMLVQAIHLYRAIVKISVRRTDSFYNKLMTLSALGIPIIVVGITVYFNHSEISSGPLGSEICFVNGLIFYASVLAPTAILTIATFSTFWVVFKNIVHTEELLQDSIENRKCKNKRRAIATITVDVCFIIVWISAILANAGFLLIGSILLYLFYALVAALGIIVCVMYVVWNHQAMDGWRDMLHCCFQDGGKSGEDVELVQLRSERLLTYEENKRASLIIHSELYGFESTPILQRTNGGKREALV